MYLSMAEAKALGLMQEEEVLQPLIRLYSGLAEEYCNTKFLPERAVLTADGEKRIYFPHTPLLKVDQVWYKGRPLTEGEDFYVYPELQMMMLEAPESFEKRKKSIEVTYVYGYEKAPYIVKKAVADLIRLETGTELGRNSDPTIISENFDGEYSYQKNGSKTIEDMKRDILTSLDRLVQPVYKAEVQETGIVRARLL